MKKLSALLSMTRIGNSFMAGIGIALGYGYAIESKNYLHLLLLIIAGMTALGFGNVINDLVDIETDKISHPERPLPQGLVTKAETIIFMIILALISLGTGHIVSPLHGVATLIPLFLLTIYSLFLKGTPLAGNIVVSLLVAYTLIYGALGGNYTPLIIPALLATIANMNREIIKDLADFEGDSKAGLTTTASLPPEVVNVILFFLSTAYIILAPLPYFLGQMWLVYALIIMSLILPLHIKWIVEWRKDKNYHHAAKTLKIQMLCGLFAILADWMASWIV